MGADMILKIGVTQRVFINRYHERCDGLDQRWSNFIRRCGGITVPIPNTVKHISEYISPFKLNGIILTGGNDLEKYGGDAPDRDELENRIIEYALHQDFPVIGICRGMQIIHDHFGGRLEHVEGHAGLNHMVTIDHRKREVNSYHQWGFRNVTQEFVPFAKSDDGNIEAMHHKTRKIHAIMWHPERLNPFNEEDIHLFNTLLK